MKISNPQVNIDISLGIPLRLHIGGGDTRKKGYYNLDILDTPNTDIIANLNYKLSLIPDNSVISVYTRHTLEHISNFMLLMEELNRVCMHDAEITVIVPHFSNPYYYSDPTHVRHFGLYTMHYFMDSEHQPGRKVPSFYTNIRFCLTNTYIEFYRTSLLDRLLVPLIRRLVNINFKTQEVYERRWSWIYPAWQITYRLSPKKKISN